MVKVKKKEMFRKINLDLIERPLDIVRLEIDGDRLRELADSIQERGLLEPIGVTPRGEKYMIVFGDRRYLAHKLLEKKDIMCRVEDIEDDQVMLDRAMENVQRVDLTPFEEGHLYVGLADKMGMNLDEISRRVGKSPGVVQRRMDILRMPESFQKAVHAGQIGLTVAEELWNCPDAARREYFVSLAIEHGITKNIAREWVAEFRKERRSEDAAGKEGKGIGPVYEDMPIYRGCDLCKHPVEYKDLKELRICAACYGLIVEVVRNGD